MKTGYYFCLILLSIVLSCKDDDINLFDKTADERVAAAIASLKSDLVAPPFGWRVKYTPEPTSGSFYVLLDFNDDNTVTIKTDLATDDDKFVSQTINYRIDSSLGLELIFQNYSFFSYLFEQDQATFGAEFEFNYVSKTSNTLLFKSKSDVGTPTQLVFEKAAQNDTKFLGVTVSKNIKALSQDLDIFSSSVKFTYTNKDLILYASLDEAKRIITIHSSSKKSNIQVSQSIAFTSGYVITGDSLAFNSVLKGTFSGVAVNIDGIRLGALSSSNLSLCVAPITLHSLPGVTSSGDAVVMESSLIAGNGTDFMQESDFFYSPINRIFNNGEPVDAQIAQNITGAGSMQLYYNYDIGSGTPFYALGFFLLNADGSTTFALREFTPVLNGNNITFNFKPTFTLFGNQTPDANVNNINIYLDILTQGNNTYVFKYSEGIYEFNNPCNGWSFVFYNGQ